MQMLIACFFLNYQTLKLNVNKIAKELAIVNKVVLCNLMFFVTYVRIAGFSLRKLKFQSKYAGQLIKCLILSMSCLWTKEELNDT